MTLGERVKQIRIGQGWSQAELARRVSKIVRRKVTQVAIHHIESRGDVSPRFVVELAQALGVSLEWLQHGRGTQKADHPPPPDNQPTPRDKTQRAFITYSGADLPKMLLDLLGKVPSGSDAEDDVVDMLRRLKKAPNDK